MLVSIRIGTEGIDHALGFQRVLVRPERFVRPEADRAVAVQERVFVDEHLPREQR